MRSALLVWASIRLLLLAGLALFAAEALGVTLASVGDPHAMVKRMVIVAQSMVRRQDQVAVLLAVATVAGAALPWLRDRAFAVGTVVALFVAAAVLPSWPFWLGFTLVLFNLGPWRLPLLLGALPGSELVAPLALFRSLDVPWRGLGVPVAVVGALGAVVVDGFARFSHYEAELFTPWPAALVDPRVTHVDQAPEGHKCDYHDVDIVGDRVVVVAELSGRLLSFPGPQVAKLVGLFPPDKMGLALDSETDEKTGTTYVMGGPDHVRALRMEAGGWVDVGRSAHIAPPMPIAYLRRYRDRLAIVSVNARSPGFFPSLATMNLNLGDVRNLPVHTPDGQRLPTIRDIEWLPTLNRLVLAPDMGDRLYLLDPDSGVATPWLSVPTQDGRPHWSPELGELILPIPSRFEIWFIEPKSGKVRTLPTQIGVRSADVDVGRGLLLTSSVLTGQVLVQRLDTGAYVDRFGTVMPMARTLKVVPGRGEAWLTTWTALYRIAY